MTAAQFTERDFDNYIATVPEKIRADVAAMAWENSWSVETHDEYESDSRRWEVAIETAKFIVDAPKNYGLEA